MSGTPADAEMTLPPAEDYLKLPRWARVAAACRNARRVQPIFAAVWSDAPGYFVKDIEKAIAIGEQSAANPAQATKAAAANAADTAAHCAALAARLAAYAAPAALAAACAAHAAAYSADAADYVAKAAPTLDPDAVAAYDCSASWAVAYLTAEAADPYAANARVLARAAAVPGWPLAVQLLADARALASSAARADFELLKALSQSKGWTDDTPVPVDLLGPLWTFGVPERWPDLSTQ
jgi:hypothetical protein